MSDDVPDDVYVDGDDAVENVPMSVVVYEVPGWQSVRILARALHCSRHFQRPC